MKWELGFLIQRRNSNFTKIVFVYKLVSWVQCTDDVSKSTLSTVYTGTISLTL